MDVMDDELGELALMWQSAPMLRSAKVKVASGVAWRGDTTSERSLSGAVGSDPFPSPPALVPPVSEAFPSVEPISEASDDEGVSLEHLEAEICSVAGRLASSTCDWLRLIAQFDRRKGWAQRGVRSCAHWLAWACSVAPVAAREYVRVANGLVGLPLLDAAFREGRLSYSKVRALTRVAGRVPEQVLLEQGLVHTASQLERLVRGFRRADGAGADQQRMRRARWFFDDEGMLVLTARLPADEGAIVVAALEHAQHQSIVAPTPSADPANAQAPAESAPVDPDPAVGPAPHPSNAPGSSEAPDPSDSPDAEETERASAADALVAVAMAALSAGPADSSGDDRHLVVVHVDADILTAAETTPTVPTVMPTSTQDDGASGLCRIENGPGLSRSEVLRISCDSALVTLIDSAVPGEQLRLGRKTRKISPALRRALRFRDGGCQFPGCHRVSHLDAHHVRHWVDGGPTDLDNLVLLCRRHHVAIHDEGFTVSSTTGIDSNWQFHRPDGVPIPRQPHCDRTIESNPPAPSPMDPENIRPGWRGERFSLADSVAAFCGATEPREFEQVPA